MPRPHIPILPEVAQSALQRSDTRRIAPRRVLAKNAFFPGLAQPVGGGDEAFLEDGGGDAVLRGAGAVGVEVLVHLVD